MGYYHCSRCGDIIANTFNYCPCQELMDLEYKPTPENIVLSKELDAIVTASIKYILEKDLPAMKQMTRLQFWFRKAYDQGKIDSIKTATIEDLKQNEHVQGLLEDLKFYANLDNWEVSAIDELCTVKTKLTKDKESFGECEQPGLASKLVLYGGKRARARLQEWE